MLSTKQKQLKSKSNSSSSKSLAAGLAYTIRELNEDYDLDRVIELWANLTMVQQMKGVDIWLRNSKNSNLSWNEYVVKLVSSCGSKILVFENDQEIFGFAYMTLENINASKPNLQASLKAIIREIYIEPAYRELAKSKQMAHVLQKALLKLDIKSFEFAVKDLAL